MMRARRSRGIRRGRKIERGRRRNETEDRSQEGRRQNDGCMAELEKCKGKQTLKRYVAKGVVQWKKRTAIKRPRVDIFKRQQCL